MEAARCVWAQIAQLAEKERRQTQLQPERGGKTQIALSRRVSKLPRLDQLHQAAAMQHRISHSNTNVIMKD